MLGFLKKKKDKQPESSVDVEFQAVDMLTVDPQVVSLDNTDNDFVNVLFLDVHRTPKAAPVSFDSYPRYFVLDLGINDPIKKFFQMVYEGYLEEASPTDILATYKQAELKEVLAANNLPTTGRKNSDLLERILSSLDVNSLELPAKYVLSAKGQEFIEHNQDLLKFFTDSKRFKMSYEQYASTKSTAPYMKYNDIIWSIFNEREMTFTSDLEREYNAEFRAIFLEEEGRLADALYHYIRALHFKVNSAAHNDLMISSSSEKKKKYEAYEYFPDRRLHQKIFDLQEHYLDKMVEKCRGQILGYREPIKQEDFRQLVFDIFEGREIELKNYY